VGIGLSTDAQLDLRRPKSATPTANCGKLAVHIARSQPTSRNRVVGRVARRKGAADAGVVWVEYKKGPHHQWDSWTGDIGGEGVVGLPTRPAPPAQGAGDAAVVRVDQTTGAGATYGLTVMLTLVALNVNDVTSLWVCVKTALNAEMLPCPAQMVL